MSFKSFFFLIILGTVMSWIAWGMVIFNFDPNQISLLQFIAFYVSLFMALGGTIFIVIDWLKSKVFRRQLLVFRVRASIRHGILFSILLLGWAFLQSQNLLAWWVLLLLILVLTVLEFFFISLQRKASYERQA